MPEFIRLSVPTGPDAAATAQAVAASLGIQLHMSVDRLDDLRVAIDEAMAEILHACPEAVEVHCEFAITETSVEVRLQARSVNPRLPDHHGLGWTVLHAITGHLHAFIDNGRLHLHLRVHSDAADWAHDHPADVSRP